MTDGLENLLRACTVRVAYPGLGRTGFFVAPGKVMTTTIDLIPVFSGSVLVHWHAEGQQRHTVSAEIDVIAEHPNGPVPSYPAITILHVQEPEGQPCIGIDPKLPIQRETLLAVGYEDQRGGEARLTRRYYRSDGLQGTFPEAALYLASAEEFNDGMAGAPVLNLRTGGICGMVVGTPPRPMTGGDCLAIPWWAVRDDLSRLLTANRAFHQRDHRWTVASGQQWTRESTLPSSKSAFDQLIDPATITSLPELGGAIGTLMLCRRMQLTELAEQLALPLEVVNSYVGGWKLPSPAALRAILTALGISDESRLDQWQQTAQTIWNSQPAVDLDETNLLFRVYIPSERLYSAEADRLLSLFRDWLIATHGHAVRQSGYRTASGEMYELFADPWAVPWNPREQFDTFSHFLALCASNPSAAIDLLGQANLSEASKSDLVTRFGREIRRLEVDLRHERERRILSLRHSLEEELVDQGADLRRVPGSELDAFLDVLVPGPSAPESLALLAGTQHIQPTAPITIINQQYVNAVGSTIIQSVQGAIHLGPEAKQLLALIARFGGEEASTLRSAVHEFEDAAAPSKSRTTAKRRLTKFLTQLAGSVHDVGLDLLGKYLESKLGL